MVAVPSGTRLSGALCGWAAYLSLLVSWMSLLSSPGKLGPHTSTCLSSLSGCSDRRKPAGQVRKSLDPLQTRLLPLTSKEGKKSLED